MINMEYTFACVERFLLQPMKTVAVTVNSKKHTPKETYNHYTLGEDTHADVDSATYLGIIRKGRLETTAEVNVETNINKARLAAYSLHCTGLHGHNSFDPATSLSLYLIYVLPVLTYGLEIVLPSKVLVDRIELVHRKTLVCLKQLLSLPDYAPDPYIYILTGLLPIQVILDTKILCFFNTIVSQSDSSLQKQIFNHQFNIKLCYSRAWAKQNQYIFVKYS